MSFTTSQDRRPPVFAFLFVCLVIARASSADSVLSVGGLQCEHRVNPLGVDETRPELSWLLASESRGAKQTAYQVLVASTPERLSPGKADLWDSGKTDSDATFGVAYAGKPLDSGQRCYWTVRVWDQDGAESEWSPPSRWSIGLLSQGDWQAQWIGYDALRGEANHAAPLEGAQWVLHGGDSLEALPKGNRLYVGKLELPDDALIASAEALVAGDNKFWLAVNGDMAIHDGVGWQGVKPVSIEGYLRPGDNELRLRVFNESPGPSGLLVKIRVELMDGDVVEVVTDGTWQSAASLGKHWPSRPIDPKELSPCAVVGDYGCAPWGESVLRDLHLPLPPLIRHEFSVKKPVKQATLYLSSLGIADAHLNGQRVSDERFTPGWSDYRKRVYYRAYDVTESVHTGMNAVGGVLSDGWYSGYVGWGRARDHYGTKPRMRMQLNLVYEDGQTEVIGTGSDWKAAAGPTSEADFLMGEAYDAQATKEGWDAPGYDDTNWDGVVVGADAPPVVEAHPGPPVVTIAEVAPVAITEPLKGVYVFDLGQYLAGVARLRVEGRPGQLIRLRFAERLNPDGTLYTTNLRGARCVDTYTCRGEGREEWEPRFTFHGFQYVEVTGLEAPPTTDTITGLAFSSDTPAVGEFACSSDMLNRLVKNIYSTQRANFIDVPTDCPQRDERLGWTGDAQVYITAACLLTDAQAFFTKWLVDLTDGQREDGQFPTVAPLVVASGDGGPAWADAGVICPWAIYETYADERLLANCYPSMKRFVDFCRSRCSEDMKAPTSFHCFGDWLSVKADTPKDVIYMAYFAHSTDLLSRAAAVLGKTADAERYRALRKEIQQAFNRDYVSPDGTIKGDTQCVYAMAISYELLDESMRVKAGERLVNDIEARGDHLSTGFVGTKDLMLALAKIGRNDIAYRLLLQESYPSWGFSIGHGATSIWERWDGWTPDGGFQDPGMNSFAHYSFGAVYRWMVENIGGIQNGGAAYRKITLAPSFAGGLDYASVRYQSIRGDIVSDWRRDGDRLQWRVTIPPNTTAELRIPRAANTVLQEGGNAIDEVEGVHAVSEGDAAYAVSVGSGSYSFTLEPVE
ncbi:MAG: family 78 glycoside hydrolase catalytic domain [Planctomycetota bacterium]